MTSTRLQAWFNPRIAASTATSDFDIRQIRRRPMTIYVTVQPGNIARMRPVLSLFFDALVNLNTDVVPEDDPTIQWQTLVLLDEFIRLGKMELLSEAAQYVRGYGLRFLYVIQSKAQLRAKYGADAAEDLFDNTGCEIVFGTNDLKLTKELSERMGDDTINVTTKNRPRFWAWMNLAKQSEAEHPHRRPLMLPQEIARLSPTEQLICGRECCRPRPPRRDGMTIRTSRRACGHRQRSQGLTWSSPRMTGRPRCRRTRRRCRRSRRRMSCPSSRTPTPRRRMWAEGAAARAGASE